MFSFDLGGGLTLEALQVGDSESLYELADRSREHLRPWLPDVAATTMDATRTYLLRTMERRSRGDGFFLGIRQDGALVGTLGVGIDRANHCASLGYWVEKAAEGRGVVTRSVKVITDRLFHSYEIQRIELRAQPGNSRSRSVAERCGFELEGTLRQALWLHDGFVDLCVYSIVRADWSKGIR